MREDFEIEYELKNNPTNQVKDYMAQGKGEVPASAVVYSNANIRP